MSSIDSAYPCTGELCLLYVRLRLTVSLYTVCCSRKASLFPADLCLVLHAHVHANGHMRLYNHTTPQICSMVPLIRVSMTVIRFIEYRIVNQVYCKGASSVAESGHNAFESIRSCEWSSRSPGLPVLLIRLRSPISTPGLVPLLPRVVGGRT